MGQFLERSFLGRRQPGPPPGWRSIPLPKTPVDAVDGFDFIDGGGGNDLIRRDNGDWDADGYVEGGAITVIDSDANDGNYEILAISTDTNPNDTIEVATGSLSAQTGDTNAHFQAGYIDPNSMVNSWTETDGVHTVNMDNNYLSDAPSEGAYVLLKFPASIDRSGGVLEQLMLFRNTPGTKPALKGQLMGVGVANNAGDMSNASTKCLWCGVAVGAQWILHLGNRTTDLGGKLLSGEAGAHHIIAELPIIYTAGNPKSAMIRGQLYDAGGNPSGTFNGERVMEPLSTQMFLQDAQNPRLFLFIAAENNDASGPHNLIFTPQWSVDEHYPRSRPRS